VREGLVTALADAETEVVGSASSGHEAIELTDRTACDTAIVDLRLPDMSGAELVSRLREAHPDMLIVVLSTYLSPHVVKACLDAGADTYVTKAAGIRELRQAVRALTAEDRPRADAEEIVARMTSFSPRPTGAHLTPQQTKVLREAAGGLTNQEIARKLFLSESTVRFHVQNLKTLLDARTRAQLTVKAAQLGLIQPDPLDPRHVE
jgi:DNA-binding NarL/FixJ family response regulator